MTNKEAIKNIVAYMYYAEDIPEEVGKAFDIAIKALKERPQGDLISREALRKAISELPNDNPSYYYTGYFLDREKVLDEIDNAPTVELFCSYLSDGEVREPCVDGPCTHITPQGEWNIIDYDKLYYKHDCCNEMFEYPYNYCPNCGAEMKGVTQ